MKTTTGERFEVLMKCRELGIPTVVWLTPILPFINDTEENIRGIMSYCVQAGVKGVLFWDIGVTLRDGDREYFYHALDQKFLGMKSRYIRTYGNAYQLPSPNNQALSAMVRAICRDNHMMYAAKDCFAYLYEFPEKYTQLTLF